MLFRVARVMVEMILLFLLFEELNEFYLRQLQGCQHKCHEAMYWVPEEDCGSEQNQRIEKEIKLNFMSNNHKGMKRFYQFDLRNNQQLEVGNYQ